MDAATFKNLAGGFDDIDSAIALASSGGIPIVGRIEGSRITAVQMEHVWVEAALDYAPSRGAKHIEPDTWVPMDPSFKQYEFLEGLDPITISGLDPEQLAQDFVASGTVNEDESWVTGFVVDVLAPPAHVRMSGEVEEVEVRANVTMMCGCPIEPGGLWDADAYDVEMIVVRNDERVGEVPLTYSGKTSQFAGAVRVEESGVYDITVYAYDPRTGNTGLDRTTFIMPYGPGK